MKDERRETKRYSCKISAKIALPVCNKGEKIIEIPGTAINISAGGLALEVISYDGPYKACANNPLWERVLSREMLSLLPVELLPEKGVSPLFVNSIITWNSVETSAADIDDFSFSDADFKSYQLGFRYYIIDEIHQKHIRSCVAEITQAA